jgi:hypothetical protein
MHLTLVHAGYRKAMFMIRTFLTWVAVILLLIFMVAVNFGPGMFPVYLLYAIIGCFGINILLTFFRMFPKSYGKLIIAPEKIILIASKQEISLDEIIILLNADEEEMEKALQDVKALRKIPRTGIYLNTSQMPELANVEVLLTPEDRTAIIRSGHTKVKVKSQFEVRPALLESPFRILQLLNPYRVPR